MGCVKIGTASHTVGSHFCLLKPWLPLLENIYNGDLSSLLFPISFHVSTKGVHDKGIAGARYQRESIYSKNSQGTMQEKENISDILSSPFSFSDLGSQRGDILPMLQNTSFLGYFMKANCESLHKSILIVLSKTRILLVSYIISRPSHKHIVK